MERVLIVAKTEMRGGVCLGGLVLNTGRSVRLLPFDSGYSHPMDTHFDLGHIWDLELEDVPNKNPPHTEDMRIKGFQQYIQTIPKPELKDFLLNQVQVNAPLVPHPSALFNGLIRFTQYNPQTGGRRGYVSRADGLGYSTGFWRFNQWLYKYEAGGAARYFYLDHLDDGTEVLVLDVKHIGFDEPLETIPPGTLLRFSLSRGFSDNPDKCYLQLSGWFGSGQYSPRAITIPHTSP